MDLVGKLGDAATTDASLSDLARGVVGSEILRIAAEIRSLKAKGARDLQPHRRDFDPAQFPAPAALLDGMRAALAAGQTNYPPSDGVLGLREAVARLLRQAARPLVPRRVGADHRRRAPAALRVVPHGARSGRRRRSIRCRRGTTTTTPTFAARGPSRSPSGPSRTSFPPSTICARICRTRGSSSSTRRSTRPARRSIPRCCGAICEAIVEENHRRERAGAKAAWLCYDQVYWQLVFGGAQARHAARGLRRGGALHDHPRRRVEELRGDRAARRLGGDAAGRAAADGRHPRSRRGLGAAPRAGGDGGAARRRRGGRQLSRRDAPARAPSGSIAWRPGSQRCARRGCPSR